MGAAIPSSWDLDFSITLTFIALVVPGLRKRGELIAALTSAGVALATQGMPHKLWIITAAACGIAAGVWAGWKERA